MENSFGYHVVCKTLSLEVKTTDLQCSSFRSKGQQHESTMIYFQLQFLKIEISAQFLKFETTLLQKSSLNIKIPGPILPFRCTIRLI